MKWRKFVRVKFVTLVVYVTQDILDCLTTSKAIDCVAGGALPGPIISILCDMVFSVHGREI